MAYITNREYGSVGSGNCICAGIGAGSSTEQPYTSASPGVTTTPPKTLQSYPALATDGTAVVVTFLDSGGGGSTLRYFHICAV